MLALDQYGVQGLELQFPAERQPFFSRLDFAFQANEKVLIVGPNGCGKSTLLQLLAGLIPAQIEIPVKWQDLKLMQPIAYCFQNPQAQLNFAYADEEIAFILENQELPRQQMPDAIAHYLGLVELQLDHNHSLTQHLSGGNQQKLQLALLLALQSEILLLDEPTAMLDQAATELFWQQIKTKMPHKCMLIVEHKISQVLDVITRLVVMDATGAIRADGPAELVFAQQREFLDAAGIWHPYSWELAPPAPPPAETTGAALLELRDFSLLKNQQTIVTAPALQLFAGDLVCLVGNNGAGKSTLLQGIRGLEQQRGSIHYHGFSANEIGLVFQNPEHQFVTDSVNAELVYSLQFTALSAQQQQAVAAEFIEKFALHALQHKHPLALSMGEKRRLSIAVSLITQPPILLLDEPTLGLDAHNCFNILQMLLTYQAQGQAIIMVTHEAEIVRRYATQVWQVDASVVTSSLPERNLLSSSNQPELRR